MAKKSGKAAKIEVVLEGADRLVIKLPKAVKKLPIGSKIPVHELVAFLKRDLPEVRGEGCSCADAWCSCVGGTIVGAKY